VQWLIVTVAGRQGATVSRLASVGFGILTLAAFAYILRRWYGVKTAIYGTLLFACSAWFLHISRFAGNDILYLWAIPALLALQILWERQSNKLLTRLAVAIGFAMLLYIPGIVWLILLSIGLQPQLIAKGWNEIEKPRSRLIVLGLLIALLVPLAWASIRTPSLLQTWIGLPHTFDQPINVVKPLGLSLTYLFYRGPGEPTIWLDRLPVLGVFGIVSFLLGVVFYIRHIAAPRTRQLLGLFVVGAVLFALQGPVTYSIVIGLVYLIVTGGIGYLLHEWLHVFPRNPLARGLGFGLLGIVIALACAYHLRSYFIAWPHNTATRSAFVKR